MLNDAAVDLAFFGSTVSVQTHDHSVAAAVCRLWAPFLAGPTATSIQVEAPRMTDKAAQLDWIHAKLNSTAMEVTPHLAFHAGAVAVGSSVVAFPANSGGGKSTLTAACLQRGFDYVTDEGMCLDYVDGAVRPYPRPIGLSAWSAELLGISATSDHETFVTAGELGSTIASANGLRLNTLVLLARVEGAAAVLEPHPRSAGVEALLTSSFNHYRRPAEAIALITTALSTASVQRLTYSDPHVAAELIAASLR